MRRLTLIALVAGCAQTGAPPGGPPDDNPPRIVRIRPDTNARNVRSGDVSMEFDDVVSERPQGATALSGLFLISPSIGEPAVSWRRTRLTIRPRGGFRSNTTYTVTMLPGLTDLDGNIDSVGTTIVFSTGATIAEGRITGTVFDWAGDKVAPRGVIEAISLPDSTNYVASADSLGDFVLGHLPDGRYLLRGLIDLNRNRRVDPRELYDTVTVTLKDSLHRELYAFVHDTSGPSIATVTVRDSITLKLTFDRALDTNLVITPALFSITAADSTELQIVSALTQRMFDRRVADSVRVKEVQDSLRTAATADSARRADSARVNTRIERPAGRRAVAVPAGTPDSSARDTVQRLAKKLTIQVPPVDVLIILEKPLPPSAVFRIRASGMRSVLGRERSTDRLFRTAKPKEVTDSTKGTPGDSTKRPVKPDTSKGLERPPETRDAGRRAAYRLLGMARPR